MKKKILILILTILISTLVVFLFSYDKKTYSFSLNQKDSISIMVFDDTSNDYVSESSIPLGNYTLNTTLSYCDGSSFIDSYDNSLGKVVTYLNGADGCYLYFDNVRDPYPNSTITSSTKSQATVNGINSNFYGYQRYYNSTYTAVSSGYVSSEIPSNVTGVNLVLLSDIIALPAYSSCTFENFYSSYTINSWSQEYFLRTNCDYSSLVATNLCSTNSSICTSYTLSNFDYSYNGSVSYNVFSGGSVSSSSTTIQKRLYYDSTANKIMETSNDNAYMPVLLQFVTSTTEPSPWEVYTSTNYTYMTACLLGDTQILVYDKKKKRFKKKKIKDIDYEDEILVWDFDNGCFAISKPLWIMKKKYADKYNELTFSDGTKLRTVLQHRIFNKEKGRFTYPMTDDTPIGTTTYNVNGEYVKLVSKKIIEKRVDYYNIITNYHINLFADGILTSCRLSNIYKIEEMKYVKDNRKLHKRSNYKMEDKWFYGLRIAEQPEDVDREGAIVITKSLDGYVEHLKENQK